MTALAQALREGASRRSRTAQADCGALGVLTVEALAPRDCAALSGKDGRAVLYAACRELQRAGEDLRREGLLYAPDEIMQYVTDEEAKAAARTVLELSGLSPAPPEEPEEPKKLEEPERPKEPEESGKPEEKKMAEAPSAGPDTGRPRRNKAAESRLEFVRDFGRNFPKVRPDTVRKADMETARKIGKQCESVRDTEKEFRKIRLDNVRKTVEKRTAAQAGKDGPPEDGAESGQVSHEFFEGLETGGKLRDMGSRTQNLWEMGQKRLQDVAVRPGKSGAPVSPEPGRRRAERDRPHEMKSEFSEAAHESKSELWAGPGRKPHESKSEFPETAHETKSEFPETAHETKSETGGLETVPPHEGKSEWKLPAEKPPHETESDFAEPPRETETETERFARHLLEGLHRAAGAR